MCGIVKLLNSCLTLGVSSGFSWGIMIYRYLPRGVINWRGCFTLRGVIAFYLTRGVSNATLLCLYFLSMIGGSTLMALLVLSGKDCLNLFAGTMLERTIFSSETNKSWLSSFLPLCPLSFSFNLNYLRDSSSNRLISYSGFGSFSFGLCITGSSHLLSVCLGNMLFGKVGVICWDF